MSQQNRSSEVARTLILRAARGAPPALSERLREEWLADLSARGGTLSQLRFALGCCWAMTVIARELADPVKAAMAASGHKSAIVCAGSDPNISRRTLTLLSIVGLHGLLIYALATGMTPTVLKPVPYPIDVTFLPRPVPQTKPLPPLGPRLRQIRPDIPLPPWTPPVVSEPPTQDPVIDTVPPRTSAPPLTERVNRVQGGPGPGFPDSDEFYPEVARRLGEKGIATVGVCVDGTGRLTGLPTIERSSGSARLDRGALKLAKAGSGHYRATTEDGRPVSACFAFGVRFQLRN